MAARFEYKEVVTVMWSNRPVEHLDDELDLLDDYDPEPDFLDNLDDWDDG